MRFTFASVLLFGFAAANTLKISLFAGQDCTSPTQTYTIGNLNQCHNTRSFGSLRQSKIAQTFFGQGLRIRTYSEPDCQGIPWESQLSDNLVCDGPTPGQLF
ncbi:hypothetical protein B7463_g10964, partial [Scytalidium lignicola]